MAAADFESLAPTASVMEHEWQKLSVGDRVRIIRLPSEWGQPNWHVDPSTRRLYRQLIAKKRSYRIAWIDAWGCPWIHGRRRPGLWWSLGIADDSWVRVKSRTKKKSLR